MKFALTMCLILAGLLVTTTGYAGHHEANQAAGEAAEEMPPVESAPPSENVGSPAAPPMEGDDGEAAEDDKK